MILFCPQVLRKAHRPGLTPRYCLEPRSWYSDLDAPGTIEGECLYQMAPTFDSSIMIHGFRFSKYFVSNMSIDAMQSRRKRPLVSVLWPFLFSNTQLVEASCPWGPYLHHCTSVTRFCHSFTFFHGPAPLLDWWGQPLPFLTMPVQRLPLLWVGMQ